MSSTNLCKNCGFALELHFEYCPRCGQEAADHLTFGVLFSNTISNYFSVDARFFRSFVPLMLKPGVLARRFVDGQRQRYLHPAQFYLFISVVFFFLFSFRVRQADNDMTEALKKGLEKEVSLDTLQHIKDSLQLEPARKAIKDTEVYTGFTDKDMADIDSLITAGKNSTDGSFSFGKGELDSLIAAGAPQDQKLNALGLEEDAGTFTRKLFAQALKVYEKRGDGILQTFYDTIPIAMFLLMPLFALLLKIFYWRRGNFAHHMVFSFYFFTFMFTTFCVLLVANMLIDIPVWIEALVMVSFILYLIIALRNFYRSSRLGAFLKANTIAFVYLLFIVPIAAFGIIFASFMLY